MQCGIFINLKISGPNGLSVIRFAHQYRPATPVFILYDDQLGLSLEDLNLLPVQKAIAKPIDYSALIAHVAPPALFFDPKQSIEESKKNTDVLDGEINSEDSLFLAIRADDFLSGTKSFFDVYVRIRAGNFVKILQAGDAFSAERVAKYLERGVVYFYLRKEAQEQYLGWCDQIAGVVLQSSKISPQIKAQQTMNHGEETMSFLRNNGISAANLEYASSFVGNVQTLIKQLNPGVNPLLNGFLADIAAYEHAVSTTMLASMLNPPLKIQSDQTVQIVGLSAMLHDIGLYRLPEVLRSEDELKMNEDQKALYRTHPTLGAQILKDIHGINPAVIQTVAQHHQRRNKKGFPSRAGAGHINRVAEMVGIADEFARLIEKIKKNPDTSLLQAVETQIFEGFSHQVVEAFRLVFFPPR